MALPWSNVDLSAALDSLLKLDSLTKCSNCHETPPVGENNVRLVKTGPCGHTICSGIGCTKISASGDNGDKIHCPALNCKSFIRDFVEDREEANRLDAIEGLKNLLLSEKNNDSPILSDQPKPSSSDTESKEWGFMEPTQEVSTKKLLCQRQNKRTRKVLSGNYVPYSDCETDESYEPGKENIKNGKRKKESTAAKKSNKIKTEDKKNFSLNKKNKRGETALHCACIKLDYQKVKRLIDEGADPNTQDNNGWTPLHEVAQRNHTDLLRMLLEAGANPNIPGGDDNYTPLHDAVEAGHVQIVELLIERGADKKLRDKIGRTPEQLARSDLILEALETNCDITCSQLDSTISSATSLSSQKIVLNPHPLILKDFKKLSTLKRWERKFKDGNHDASRVAVKLELKQNNLPVNLTHYVIDDSLDSDMMEKADQSYSVPLYESLVMGAWILNFQWIEDCLSKENIVNEDPYVVTNENSCIIKVPVIALNGYRLNAKRQLPRLFDGMNIFLHGSFQNPFPAKKELELILRKGGAVVLKREPDPESIPANEKTFPYHSNPKGPLSKCSHYILYQEGQKSGKTLIKFNMEHLKAVSVEWLFACLNSFAIIDLDDFDRSLN